MLFSLLFTLFSCSKSSIVSSTQTESQQSVTELSIAMLHIAPKLIKTESDLTHNAKLIEQGMRQAKAQGAQWVLTPELALTGYKFKHTLGTNWIKAGTDRWTQYLQGIAKELNLVLFLSHLEQNPNTLKSYNTLFVINRAGQIIHRHQKINTIPGSESWSTKGTQTSVVNVDNINVGLLICADAWPTTHAASLKNKGAELIISSANWAPGLYGPGNTWQKRSNETNLPIFVNNRTGIEFDFDMTKSNSVVTIPQPELALDTKNRLFEHASLDNTLVVLTVELPIQKIKSIHKSKLESEVKN